MKYSQGFSLLELLVVMLLIVVMGFMLVLNFRAPSSGSIGRHQVSSVLISDVRHMQLLALAGSLYAPSGSPQLSTCGYGIHYVDASSYLLFARVLGAVSCSSVATQLYDPNSDRTIELRTITNSNIVFGSPFSDVYYSIPYASVFIDGRPLTPSSVPSTQVKIITPSLPSDPNVTYVHIGASGNIDLEN